MKEAHEYARDFNSFTNKEEAILQISHEFLAELQEIPEFQGREKSRAVVKLLDRQDGKWDYLSDLVGGQIKKGGFRVIFAKMFPDIFCFWKIRKTLLQ